jgi:hypothetical protein
MQLWRHPENSNQMTDVFTFHLLKLGSAVAQLLSRSSIMTVGTSSSYSNLLLSFRNDDCSRLIYRYYPRIVDVKHPVWYKMMFVHCLDQIRSIPSISGLRNFTYSIKTDFHILRVGFFFKNAFEQSLPAKRCFIKRIFNVVKFSVLKGRLP